MALNAHLAGELDSPTTIPRGIRIGRTIRGTMGTIRIMVGRVEPHTSTTPTCTIRGTVTLRSTTIRIMPGGHIMRQTIRTEATSMQQGIPVRDVQAEVIDGMVRRIVARLERDIQDQRLEYQTGREQARLLAAETRVAREPVQQMCHAGRAVPRAAAMGRSIEPHQPAAEVHAVRQAAE